MGVAVEGPDDATSLDIEEFDGFVVASRSNDCPVRRKSEGPHTIVVPGKNSHPDACDCIKDGDFTRPQANRDEVFPACKG